MILDSPEFALIESFDPSPFRFEVDHDRLYLDALDRDLKREKLGMVCDTHLRLAGRFHCCSIFHNTISY